MPVHAAHLSGIIHRDLKPENVMYDPLTEQVKLLDFGIAAQADLAPEQRLTRAGFFVGTLMYVAPEALSGQLVTAAADQYSLATIAYYLLSASLPYSGRSQRELFTQLLSQPPIPLNSSGRGPACGAPIEEVVMRRPVARPGLSLPGCDRVRRRAQGSGGGTAHRAARDIALQGQEHHATQRALLSAARLAPLCE